MDARERARARAKRLIISDFLLRILFGATPSQLDASARRDKKFFRHPQLINAARHPHEKWHNYGLSAFLSYRGNSLGAAFRTPSIVIREGYSKQSDEEQLCISGCDAG